MQFKSVFVLAAVAITGARAAHLENGDQTLIVYLGSQGVVPPQVDCAAQQIASRMFAQIGVRIKWKHGSPDRDVARTERAMVIDVTRQMPPAGTAADAFAAATPYEGSRITVFYSRLEWLREHERLAPVLLAHVLVHEITHNLEGISRHSATGVMKAHWTLADFDDMVRKPLPFAHEDLELIQLGLLSRMARAWSPASQ